MNGCLLVCGPPCAGKSTLAQLLAARYRWPLLAKDDYKDRVFHHLGGRDRDWSRRVSLLAWELLIEEALRLLAHGVDCVLEGNFRAAQGAELRARAVPGVQFLEVRIVASAEVLLERYRARALSGTRHPGHVDLEALTEIESELRAPSSPPAALGQLLEWNTDSSFDPSALLPPLDAFARFSDPARGTRG